MQRRSNPPPPSLLFLDPHVAPATDSCAPDNGASILGDCCEVPSAGGAVEGAAGVAGVHPRVGRPGGVPFSKERGGSFFLPLSVAAEATSGVVTEASWGEVGERLTRCGMLVCSMAGSSAGAKASVRNARELGRSSSEVGTNVTGREF